MGWIAGWQAGWLADWCCWFRWEFFFWMITTSCLPHIRVVCLKCARVEYNCRWLYRVQWGVHRVAHALSAGAARILCYNFRTKSWCSPLFLPQCRLQKGCCCIDAKVRFSQVNYSVCLSNNKWSLDVAFPKITDLQNKN